jgi:hypothetical protein
MNNKKFTSGYLTQSGPWIPCLREGETTYNLTPEELSTLLRRAFADGYEFAKGIYVEPNITTITNWTAAQAVEEV